MRITPEDVKTFSFCPFLYNRGGTAKLYEKPPPFVKAMKDSICAAEVEATKSKGFVDNRMLGKYWNKIWWPLATSLGLSAKEIEEKTFSAAMKFNSYCNYDIVGTGYFTLGVGVPLEKKLLSGVLHSKLDIIKVPKKIDKYINIINIGWEKVSRRTLSQDIKTMAEMYLLQDLDKDIVYINVDLLAKNNEINISSCYYDKDNIAEAGKIIEFLARGMKQNINYHPYWTCERCNKCQTSKS